MMKERPALIADRHARHALRVLGKNPDEGVIGLAFRHCEALMLLGDAANALLMPFLDLDDGTFKELDLDECIKDWRNVAVLQQQALHLHAGFMLDREPLELPVTFQAQQIQHADESLTVGWCSPFIASVIRSRHASYNDMETTYGTEDAFNLYEMINIDLLADWKAHRSAHE